MGDQDRRDVGMRFVERVHRLQELLACGHIEPRRRFVEQKQSRIRDERAGNECATSFTLRQRRPVRRRPCRDRPTDAIIASARSQLVAARCPAHREVDGGGDARQHHLAHGQRILKPVAGIHVSDGMAQPSQVDPAHLFAEDVHGAARWERSRRHRSRAVCSCPRRWDPAAPSARRRARSGRCRR